MKFSVIIPSFDPAPDQLHPQPCDGSNHDESWTGAVCAELATRKTAGG